MVKKYTSRTYTSSLIVWLASLTREAEKRAADFGPLTGPIRERQRPWSSTLDEIEAERQRDLEASLRCAA